MKLQPGEPPERFRVLGLPVLTKNKGTAAKFCQPCPAYEETRCRIYSERPQYCREFECVLFKSVNAGRMQPEAALRVIRTAKQRVDKVLELLALLGDNDEEIAVAARFRKLSQRMEKERPVDEQAAEMFGELTLAMHDLNVLLSDAFYPGAAH